ncbi:hypothetical protein BH10ACT1_BH10ACT1_11710 [soil metagenome]
MGLALASCAATLTGLSVGAAELTPAGAETSTVGSAYVAVTPCRVLDTRAAVAGPLGAREVRSFQVAGTGAGFAVQGGKSGGCAVPADATAVEASVTAVGPSATGFARLWPAGSTEPTATFLNFTEGQSITNTGAIPLSTAAGAADVSLRNYAPASGYVVDIQGYFTNSGAGASYVAVTPCRVLDTRADVVGPFDSGSTRSFQVAGTGGVFGAQGGRSGGCSVPDDATAVEASVTAVVPSRTGFARLWPPGTMEPTATFLNFTGGQSITNTGAVPLSAAEGISDVFLRNYSLSSDYVVDVQGYFTATSAGSPAIA